jgi:hypothetical protein
LSEPPVKNKDEKREEKQHEKHEKTWSDPLSTIAWGAISIWVGLVLLADNLGWLSNLGWITLPGIPFPFRLRLWQLIFNGAGVIILGDVVVQLLMPEYRHHIAGNIVVGLLFIGIGLSDLIRWNVNGALVLIIIGVAILLRAMWWRI